ncbi:MAG: UPF0280 family protein [archaeon]|nr:UPF0280 family protein [archaeon]
MKTHFEVKETILTIICDDGLLPTAKAAVFEAREILESKIMADPFFGITFDPYPVDPGDHPLVQRMCRASSLAGVGPMAGVAGAVAVFVVEKLVSAGAKEAIVENGGDIAFYSGREVPIGVFADHPVFKDLAFSVSSPGITGICSSSAKVGPSVSLGNSNVCTVFSDDVILADCCATALGNKVTGEDVLGESVESVCEVEGVLGCVACCGDKIAMAGEVPELVPAKYDDLVY